MDRPKVEIEEPGKGFSRVTVTFPEDPRTTALNCAARLRRAASMAHGDPPQGVDPDVLDFEAGVLEGLADMLTPPPACNFDLCEDWLALYVHFRPPKGMREMPPDWVDAVAAFCKWLKAEAAKDARNRVAVRLGVQYAERCRECKAKSGNAAAMREALTQVQIGFGDNVLGPIGDVPNDWEIAEAKRLCKVVDSALSAPPRNCDVGTAEEQEKRFDSFCDAHYEPNNVDAECWGCPLMSHRNKCEFAWAQMPYEEGGAE